MFVTAFTLYILGFCVMAPIVHVIRILGAEDFIANTAGAFGELVNGFDVILQARSSDKLLITFIALERNLFQVVNFHMGGQVYNFCPADITLGWSHFMVEQMALVKIPRFLHFAAYRAWDWLLIMMRDVSVEGS